RAARRLLPGRRGDGTRLGRQALDPPDHGLGLLERHHVNRRGRVLTPDEIERAVSSYASRRSCASIGREVQGNPETVRQALLKAGAAMRSPGDHEPWSLERPRLRYGRLRGAGSTPLPALVPATCGRTA